MIPTPQKTIAEIKQIDSFKFRKNGQELKFEFEGEAARKATDMATFIGLLDVAKTSVKQMFLLRASEANNLIKKISKNPITPIQCQEKNNHQNRSKLSPQIIQSTGCRKKTQATNAGASGGVAGQRGSLAAKRKTLPRK